jgi:putative membrane protein
LQWPVTSGNKNEDSVDSAQDINDQKDTSGVLARPADSIATTPVDKDVADFAVKAADVGMAEVALGKLAQEKAQNQRIKILAP